MSELLNVGTIVRKPGAGADRILAKMQSARERRRECMAAILSKRREGMMVAPVPCYGITEAMCQTKARAAYCATRRAGGSVEAANDAFEAELARWRPLIGTPTDAFFTEE